MMGTSVLRQQLVMSHILTDLAAELRTARSIDDLTRLWMERCDDTVGDVREALQEVYSEVLAKLQPGVAG